ncbi:type II toxin-antitoxin system VapC family toxin [Dyadobacter luticola]|uniref:PIN domain-containing protein n=1 Tax=Dyadobacter luticola TaxID=1979387 RepID=A0A5R9KP42_9BACT|nr:type II toxin-antitoxin system VapC family toxin [Dyadobacter luticola]TLU97874.1 PIN domain-containing protein [Dyadobacter luticola]
MTNEKHKVFIDSSILVEFRKHSRTELLLHLLDNPNLDLVINSVVLSEYTFHLLAIEGKKAPRTIKENQQIPEILTTDRPQSFLSIFTVLENGNEVIPVYLRMMESYNLLPNDALILATCKLHNIKMLASHDATDFETACSAENLILIQTPEDFISNH